IARERDLSVGAYAPLRDLESARQRLENARENLNASTPQGKQRLVELENDVRNAETAWDSSRAKLRTRRKERAAKALAAELEQSKATLDAEIDGLKKRLKNVNDDLKKSESELGDAMVPVPRVDDLRLQIAGEESFLNRLRMEKARLEIESMPDVH